MQIKVDIKGLKEFKGYMEALQKNQLPFAIAKAINDTANEVKTELTNEMKKVFDRPTSYTLNSLFIKPATKRDLTATIGLKEWGGKGTPASKYLAPQIFGGNRGFKRSEKALQRSGLLPSGMYWVPGKGAKLDAYGNISGSQMTQILSVLQASFDTAQNMTARSRVKNRKPRDFFVVKQRHGGLVPGVWERLPETGSAIAGYKGPNALQKGLRKGKSYSVIQGRRVRPVLIFVKSPNYKPRFLFFETAQKTVDKVWLNKMGEAIQYALATAR